MTLVGITLIALVVSGRRPAITTFLMLTVIGVIASVIGAYYYLLIVKTMYFDEPVEGFVPMPGELKAVLGITGLFTLLFFVYPAPLLNAAIVAAKSLF